MEIIFVDDSFEDFKFWKKSGNKAILKKIEHLLNAILENPFEGIGKPEALKHNLSGKWSRRINEEHRIVYAIEGKYVYIFSLKGHYNK